MTNDPVSYIASKCIWDTESTAEMYFAFIPSGDGSLTTRPIPWSEVESGSPYIRVWNDGGTPKISLGIKGGSGEIDVASNKIVNVTDPTNDQDASTKKYVDDILDKPSGIYYGTYSFIHDNNGDNPDDWTADETGGTIVVVTSIDGHKKVVKFDNTGAGVVNLTQAINQSVGTIEFYMRAEQTDMWFILNVQDGSAADEITFAFGNNGHFKVYNTGWKNLPIDTTYVADQWYRIKIVFDCTESTWDVYIDEDSKGSPGFRGNPTTMDTITFRTIAATSAFYVDAIGYDWNSNYDVGDNLKQIYYSLKEE